MGVVTIHDVAKRAGVAVSSVSRVLTNHPDVSGAMKARVEKAALELGYSPDPVAQSMRSGSTRLVGLVVRDYANPFFGEIIGGIEECLTTAGYTLLVTSSGPAGKQDTERIAMLGRRRVDALIISTASDRSTAVRKAIQAFKKPVVLLDREFPNLTSGVVLHDHAAGVRDATLDLLAKGHTRIAMITGSQDIWPTRQRILGFESAFEVAHADVVLPLEIAEEFSTSFARGKALDLLGLPKTRRPTAFIAGGVQATIGILEALSQLDIRPGEEMSLVVCDDLPWLRILRPRISAVSRDAQGMGWAAAEMVLSLVGGSQPGTVLLPTEYEARETSVPIRARAARR